MKRTPLARKSPLLRRTALRSHPKPTNRNEPGRAEWKEQHGGFCEVCGRFHMHLHHHHVYPERLVRQAGGDPYSPANGMRICERCHMNHHAAFKRIPLPLVPDAAVAFLSDLIGEERAADWFSRFYAPEVGPGYGWRP